MLNSFSRSAWLRLIEEDEEEPSPVIMALKLWSQENNNGIAWVAGNFGPKNARLSMWRLVKVNTESKGQQAHDVLQKTISLANEKKSYSPS
jgi:hypothetical protein